MAPASAADWLNSRAGFVSLLVGALLVRVLVGLSSYSGELRVPAT
jgi:hypothetical protein